MITKEDGEWKLRSKDGKEELAKGSLKTVMGENEKRKKRSQPKAETKGVIKDIQEWAREKIGRPKGGGLSYKGPTGGYARGYPPRRDLDSKTPTGKWGKWRPADGSKPK